MSDGATNPYRPGFNQQPPVLAGRDGILADAEDMIEEIEAGITPRPILLPGPRGVGKSVLLTAIAARAAERGWPRLHVEVLRGESLLSEFLKRVDATIRLLEQRPPPRRRVKAVTGKIGVPGILGLEVQAEMSGQPGDAVLSVSSALQRLAEASNGVGVVLTLDEVQLADKSDLGKIGAALQEGVDLNWPLLVVAAGLPSMREAGNVVTYFERGLWREVGLLGDDARKALLQPAVDSGRPFTDEAGELLLKSAGGYAYAIQVYGKHAWRHSEGLANIDLTSAKKAEETGTRELEDGLYANRWAQATTREKEYLVAIAALLERGDVPTGRAVAALYGVPGKSLSVYRQRLLDKGTIFAVGDVLRFVIPGFGAYVLKQASAEGMDITTEETRESRRRRG